MASIANIPRLMETARTLRARGDADGAREMLRRVLAADPAHVPALHLLGHIHLSRHQSGPAIAALAQAARIAPGPELLADLALAHTEARDPAAALGVLRKALDLAPDWPRLHFDLGNALLDHGQVPAAADAFRHAIALRPDYVEALNNLGNAMRALGQPDAALAAYQRALALRPDGPILRRNAEEAEAELRALREVHARLSAGDGAGAEAACRALLAADPDAIGPTYLLAACRHLARDTAGAIALLRPLLDRAPDHVGAWSELGGAYLTAGQYPDALAALDRTLELDPANLPAMLNRGETLNQLGRRQEALAAYDAALAIAPDYVLALGNRANLLARLGRATDALADYERAAALAPDRADTHFNHGNTLQGLGRHQDAIAAYDRAVALRPDHANALNNRGVSLRHLDRFAEGRASFEAALAARPGLPTALVNLAIELDEAGDTDAAHVLFQRALEGAPDLFQARCGLLGGIIPYVRGKSHALDQMRAAFPAALEEFFAWARAHGHGVDAVGEAYPFALAYHDRDNRDLLMLHGRLCAAAMADWQRTAGLDRPPPRPGSAGDGRIRLGIVMAQFWNHSVWLAIVKGWVAQLDRTRFSIHLFHTGARDDAETAWARAHADSFTQATPGAPMGLDAWVRAIQAATPDVLVYPEFGMDQITMRLASMRLAPVQAASWGHPETTGLPVMDHYISAAAFEPPDADKVYSEQLLRLPRLGCSYERLPVTAEPFDLGGIGIPPGATLMVCPGTPFKYTPETDAMLVEIARRVPEGRLLFFTYQRSTALSQRVAERLAAAFRDAGMDFSRHAVLLPWLPRPRFYHLLQRADLMLDTVGFSGFNTVMQALECGLPVATMAGRFLRGRLGSGILRTMGMGELVATDTAAYVDIATRLATDPAFNAAARQRIAERREALFDDVATVRALEDFLERAVRQPG